MLIGPVELHRLSRRIQAFGLAPVSRFIDYLIRVLFACWLPHGATVGQRVRLGYGGLCIVVHNDSVIEDDVHIDEGVTIGGNARVKGVPKILRGCYIGAGAKIIGPVTVGPYSIVGANSVVVKDVPERVVVVGVPAKIVHENIDPNEYLHAHLVQPPTSTID
jgi:serine O-acetyltransferase